VNQGSDKVTVIFMVAVMAFAIVLVDDRWVRVVLGLVPALLLAQRAVGGGGVGARPEEGIEGLPAGEERRTNPTLREQIQELLKLIREFYTTCHMVAVGQLEASKAKSKAQVVERRLNAMMSEMLEQLDDAATE
jgi:hypothetical protein